MAQITTVTLSSSAWTRVDSLASHTYIEISHPTEDISVGVRITGSDPGGGTAWNASGSRRMKPDGEYAMRLATSDQVWMRAASGSPAVDVSEATA